MNDRLAGSSSSNPIEYKGWCIYCSGEEHWAEQFICHPIDGFAHEKAVLRQTVEECKEYIDAI